MSRMKSGPDGSLIPMAEQDRSRRDRSATEEGIALVTAALPRGPIGPYQLQAAIAALHDEAQSPEATDWPQIAALYDVLLRLDDNPVSAYTQPGWPRTSSSSATSIDRSLACRAGHPTVTSRTTPASRESWASGSTGIRMALRSFSVNRDNRPLLKAVFG